MNNIFQDLEKDSFNKGKEDARKLAFAFWSLHGGNQKPWDDLPYSLKSSPAGKLCRKYIKTGKNEYLEKAGKEIAGPNWYTALGRTF
jgi:hypothetical protein